jgi:hypothetical protein
VFFFFILILFLSYFICSKEVLKIRGKYKNDLEKIKRYVVYVFGRSPNHQEVEDICSLLKQNLVNEEEVSDGPK